MTTKVVRNISEQDLSIPDIGFVKSGETLTVPSDFNNANFVEVKEADAKEEIKAKKITK